MGEFDKVIYDLIDNESFFRRECPACFKNFKIEIGEDKTYNLEYMLRNYLIDRNKRGNINYNCPYCGQVADDFYWWTDEQADYLTGIIDYLIAEVINEKYLNESKEEKLESNYPKMEPEIFNPFKKVELECCDANLKVLKVAEEINCCFCGSDHKLEH